MNKSDALELIDALRSGEYIQGTGRLASTWQGEESNCCLGVLCRIKGLKGVSAIGSIRYGGCLIYPPKGIGGLKSESGYLGSCDGINYTLAKLNDEGYSFDEIADILYWYVRSGLIEEV